MEKKSRQKKLLEILKRDPSSNQEDILTRLQRLGVKTTQASISRDIAELGIIKVDGRYKMPSLEPGQSSIVDKLHADRAGDNLIVLRTGAGHAQLAAVQIDRARISEIIGTIAGDDTIFIAVAGKDEQSRVIKKIFTLFEHS